MKSVLSVRDLTKVYPGKGGKTAVDGISFDLQPGEILGFLGPNGSGKTTTIQMLLGTLTASSGTILYFGKELSEHRSDILQHVAFASTYASLPWVLSIRENLEVFGRLYGLPKEESRQRFLPLLERFGLAKYEKSKVSSLSAGQITRLMLIKAFFIQPKIVLLDEPTASLDPDVAEEICSFILEERDKKHISVLFTSHKMEEATRLCDRAIFIRQGKIIANDLPKNLSRTVSSFQLKLTVTEGLEDLLHLAKEHHLTLKQDHAQVTLTLQEHEIPLFLNRIGKREITYSNIQIEEPSLEDFFLHIARGS